MFSLRTKGPRVADTASCRDLYLNLLKQSLLGLTYEDDSHLYPDAMGGEARRVPHDRARRIIGQDWPVRAATMIGEARLENIRRCIESVIADGVAGDLIETGVWRGGAVIFMRGVLKAYEVTDRTVWAADSFEGLPPPNADKYPQDTGLNLEQYQELAVSLEEVKKNFERHQLLDSQVRFIVGWFRDSLPAAEIREIAVLRLDGDLYESTMDALRNLYARVQPGGYVIVDDFNIPACRAAVADFRDGLGIIEPLERVDWASVYWRRVR